MRTTIQEAAKMEAYLKFYAEYAACGMPVKRQNKWPVKKADQLTPTPSNNSRRKK